jgi:signal transduction histidine kinase/HD-GYP domain-containing protein (c-di-GMP phosphodiesterase class II)
VSKAEPIRTGGSPLRALSSLSFAVQSAFDTNGLVTAVAEHVLELARADTFALLLLDYETGDLDGDAFERGCRGAVAHARLVPRQSGFLGRLLRRETLIVDDPSAGAGGGLDRDEVPWRSGTPETLIGVPILVGTSLLGVALIGYRRRVAVSDRRRRALLFLAEQIGLAVDRIRTRSELEKRLKQLEDAKSQLRRIDEAKSDLISIVSHELRTPLTAIKAYTETLLDNVGSPSFTMQEKFLGIINEECDRLTRMVNDVLDLSRMDSGRRRLKVVPLALGRLLAEVVPTVEPDLRAKRLRLRIAVPEGLPAIEADPDLLKQVLVNLIHNAAKFSRSDTEVTVAATAAGDRVEIAVEDQGMGIPEDKLARVFDRFYRIEGEGGERVAGTGLGLAIVKSVVELHGGSIRVESEVGRGSRFAMDFPREQRGFRTLIQSLAPFFEQPELRALLQHSVEMIGEVMDARIVSLMFFTPDGSELVIQASHGLDQDTVARTRVKVGDSIAGWVAKTAEALLVPDIERDRRFRKMNHPQYETKSLLCVPVKLAGETVGVVNVNNKKTGVPFDPDDLSLLIAVTKRVAIALERVRAAGAATDLEATVGTIRAIIRARRNHLLPSSRRAFKLATELGRRLRLEADDLDVLGYVARVHDIGMLAVGENLLFSTRRWSDGEHREVEAHPQAGVQMLRTIEFASKVNEIILGHHEHWDGRGYPRGLLRDQIPLAARVLAVVDAFEAMTMGRPYREPYTEAEALAELRRCAGSQFDPSVVEEFARLLAERDATASPPPDLPAPADPAPADPAPARPLAPEWNRDAVR